ncbi:hypothetical protein, partial [Lacticaseibacillus paracasei]|uniref:hypothetical protein n=1 Tax=Lacticaseibacillus paracasei TaxID=1597 RepID=UPI000E13B726
DYFSTPESVDPKNQELGEIKKVGLDFRSVVRRHLTEGNTWQWQVERLLSNGRVNTDSKDEFRTKEKTPNDVIMEVRSLQLD